MRSSGMEQLGNFELFDAKCLQVGFSHETGRSLALQEVSLGVDLRYERAPNTDLFSFLYRYNDASDPVGRESAKHSWRFSLCPPRLQA